jgi:large subunit ribosomal protein L32e
MIRMNPRKKPKFSRPNAASLKRLGSRWVKSRGLHAKVRRHERGKLKMPTIGYGAPKKFRYLHPSGFKEALVYNFNDLQTIDPKTGAARIANSVGGKKRKEILKKAEELKIKVLNP